MADTGNDSPFGFLSRKIGPVPIWIIALALAGAYYWYKQKGPGKSAAAAGPADAIDPATGVAYAIEVATLQQQLADLQSTGTGSGSGAGMSRWRTPSGTSTPPPSGTTTPPPSGTSTPPPSGTTTPPPSGTTTPPSGTTTPPASGGKITVAPTGFHVVSVQNGDAVTLAWNKLTPPAGQGPVKAYVIAYGPTPGSQAYTYTALPDATSATIGGVGGATQGNTKHYFEIWAEPAPTGGPHAGPVEATTTKPPS